MDRTTPSWDREQPESPRWDAVSRTAEPWDQAPRSYQPWGQGQPHRGLKPGLVLVVALVVLAGIALAVVFPPLVATNTGSPVSRKVSDQVFPAQLVSEIGHRGWGLAAAGRRSAGGRIHVRPDTETTAS
jgi:hypothetical protein